MHDGEVGRMPQGNIVPHSARNFPSGEGGQEGRETAEQAAVALGIAAAKPLQVTMISLPLQRHHLILLVTNLHRQLFTT